MSQQGKLGITDHGVQVNRIGDGEEAGDWEDEQGDRFRILSISMIPSRPHVEYLSALTWAFRPYQPNMAQHATKALFIWAATVWLKRLWAGCGDKAAVMNVGRLAIQLWTGCIAFLD